MKKWILFVLLGLLLAGCNATSNTHESGTVSETNIDSINFRSKTDFISDELYTPGEPGVYVGNMVPDKETALAVAEAVFRGTHTGEYYENMQATDIVYYTEDGVWVVIFSEQDENMVGGGWSIAISEADGKVLYAVSGE